MADQPRVKSLIKQLREAVEAVLSVAENVSQEEWETIVPEENRTVGQLVHHLQYPFPIQIGWVMSVANGQNLPVVSKEDGDYFNARHAQEFQNPDKEETLDWFKKNLADARAKLGTLTDEQLDRSAPFTLPYLSEHPNDGQVAQRLLGSDHITARQIAEWNKINHCHHHVRQIKETLRIA